MTIKSLPSLKTERNVPVNRTGTLYCRVATESNKPHQHARRESNPQPAALETAALPIELLASRTHSCPIDGHPLLAFDFMQRMPTKPRAVLF